MQPAQRAYAIEEHAALLRPDTDINQLEQKSFRARTSHVTDLVGWCQSCHEVRKSFSRSQHIHNRTEDLIQVQDKIQYHIHLFNFDLPLDRMDIQLFTISSFLIRHTRDRKETMAWSIQNEKKLDVYRVRMSKTLMTTFFYKIGSRSGDKKVRAYHLPSVKKYDTPGGGILITKDLIRQTPSKCKWISHEALRRSL